MILNRTDENFNMYFKFVVLNFNFTVVKLSPQLLEKSNRLCNYVLTVCSTTLWVGQVDKKATQQDLTNLFEEFGQIESINVSISC